METWDVWKFKAAHSIRKVDIMAILLTNGKFYIAHNRTGAVIKVADIEHAQDFYSVERAINQRNRTPGKSASGLLCLQPVQKQ